MIKSLMEESNEEDYKRKKRWTDDEDEDMWDMGDDFNEGFEKADYSVSDFYPDRYCKEVSNLTTECFEESILELWANKGAFDETSDRTIASLTKEDILNRVNKGNYR